MALQHPLDPKDTLCNREEPGTRKSQVPLALALGKIASQHTQKHLVASACVSVFLSTPEPSILFLQQGPSATPVPSAIQVWCLQQHCVSPLLPILDSESSFLVYSLILVELVHK